MFAMGFLFVMLRSGFDYVTLRYSIAIYYITLWIGLRYVTFFFLLQYLLRLIETLDRRIQADKDVLFHFTELRKEVGDLPQNTVVSSTFQNYSDSYSRVRIICEVASQKGSVTLSDCICFNTGSY